MDQRALLRQHYGNGILPLIFSNDIERGTGAPESIIPAELMNSSSSSSNNELEPAAYPSGLPAAYPSWLPAAEHSLYPYIDKKAVVHMCKKIYAGVKHHYKTTNADELKQIKTSLARIIKHIQSVPRDEFENNYKKDEEFKKYVILMLK